MKSMKGGIFEKKPETGKNMHMYVSERLELRIETDRKRPSEKMEIHSDDVGNLKTFVNRRNIWIHS